MAVFGGDPAKVTIFGESAGAWSVCVRYLSPVGPVRVAVGRISGNLLKRLTLHEVSIADSAGAPFLKLDSASTRYVIRSFISK